MWQSAMSVLALPPDKLADFCRRHGLRSLALFGSFGHGNASESRNGDLLFELEAGRHMGLLTLFQMQAELSDQTGRRGTSGRVQA